MNEFITQNQEILIPLGSAVIVAIIDKIVTRSKLKDNNLVDVIKSASVGLFKNLFKRKQK